MTLAFVVHKRNHGSSCAAQAIHFETVRRSLGFSGRTNHTQSNRIESNRIESNRTEQSSAARMKIQYEIRHRVTSEEKEQSMKNNV